MTLLEHLRQYFQAIGADAGAAAAGPDEARQTPVLRTTDADLGWLARAGGFGGYGPNCCEFHEMPRWPQGDLALTVRVSYGPAEAN